MGWFAKGLPFGMASKMAFQKTPGNLLAIYMYLLGPWQEHNIMLRRKGNTRKWKTWCEPSRVMSWKQNLKTIKSIKKKKKRTQPFPPKCQNFCKTGSVWSWERMFSGQVFLQTSRQGHAPGMRHKRGTELWEWNFTDFSLAWDKPCSSSHAAQMAQSSVTRERRREKGIKHECCWMF